MLDHLTTENLNNYCQITK